MKIKYRVYQFLTKCAYKQIGQSRKKNSPMCDIILFSSFQAHLNHFNVSFESWTYIGIIDIELFIMQFVNDDKYIFVTGMKDKTTSGTYHHSLINHADHVAVYNSYCTLCGYLFQEWIIIYNYSHKILL